MIKEPNPSTDEDEILSFMLGQRENLPASLHKKRVIYNYILTQLLEHRQEKQISILLQRLFSLGRTASYEFIKKAKYLHGSFFTLDKGMEIYKQQQDIEKALRWAEEMEDITAFNKALELRDKLLQRLPEKQDPEGGDGGPKNYFMIIKASGENLKLPLKHLDVMSEKEKQELLMISQDDGVDENFMDVENKIDEQGNGK